MTEKKKKFFAFKKLSALLLLFGTIIACTNEEFIDKLENSNNFKKSKVNLEELKKLKPNAAKKIIGVKNKNVDSRLIHDNLNNFSFDTDNMLLIENGNKYWLTTRIIRDTLVDNSLIENLLLSPNNNGGFIPFIFQYNLNDNEKNLIANDLPVPNLWSKTRINSIDNYDSTIYNNISNKVLFDGGGDYSGQVFLIEGNCYIVDHAQNIEGTTDILITYIQVNCPSDINVGGSDDSGGSSSGSGGSFTVYGDNTGGSSSNNDGSTDGYSSGSSGNAVTSPLIEESGAGNGPCEELKKIATKNVTNLPTPGNIITLLNDLKTKSATGGAFNNNGNEAGYNVYPSDLTNTNFVADYYTMLANQVGITDIGQLVGNNQLSYMMHLHGLTHYSCFTPDDIHALYAFLSNGNITDENMFTSFLVSAYGTHYAIKIIDKQAFLNWGNSYYQYWHIDIMKDGLNKQYFKSMPIKSDVGTNEKEVAKFFKGNGIELYKNNGNFTTWTKIGIDNNGNKVEKPCK